MANTFVNKGAMSPSAFLGDGVGSGFFERLLQEKGAILDGVVDDSEAFQAALDAVPNTRIFECMIPRWCNSIKINSGITIDASKIYLDFGGAKLDATGMTSGTAITMTGTGTPEGNQSYGQQLGGINRMKLLGPGRTTSVDGMLMTGSSDDVSIVGSARTLIQNSKIRYFRKGVTLYHRAYLSTFFNCEIGSSRLAIYSKAGGKDAYENVGFTRCTIGNSDMNVYVEDGYLHFVNCSIDYAEFVQMAVRSGMLSLLDCHVEFSIKMAQYGVATNTNNAIYNGVAPLCAIDMSPGQTSSTLCTDLGLTNTSNTTSQSFAAFRMIGGHMALTAARAGATNSLRVIVNNAGNGQVYFGGKMRCNFGSNVPSSGYFCHTLSAADATGNFSGNFNWEPGAWFNTTDDIVNMMHETPAHLTGTLDHGFSISPAHNMFGSSGFGPWQTTGLTSFESTAGLMDDLCILEDSNASTAITIPANKLTGTAGSAAFDTTFAHSGTRSLKLTKVGAALATYPLKFGFTFARNPSTNSRPMLRLALGKPSTGAPATGSVTIAMKFIKPEYKYLSSGEIRTNPTNGATMLSGGSYATAADGQAPHNTTGIKGKSGSLYIDVATIPSGGWVYCQLNSDPDYSYIPAWATHIQVEIDMKNCDPGQINLDQLDLQYM